MHLSSKSRHVSLIKYDLELALAFLQLDHLTGIDIILAEIPDSSDFSSGDNVYAVGNGLNHGIGISKGIVSIPVVNIDYDETVRSVIHAI